MKSGLIIQKPKTEDARYERIFPGGGEPVNWKKYLPSYEPQRRTNFCVAFSRLNCAEAVAKKAKIKLNLSDRHLAVISGTSYNGNSLFNVTEAFRKQGVVKERVCPWRPEWLTEPRKNWHRIFDLSSVRKDARRYFGGNYSWVRTKQAMRDALAYSPLQVGLGIGYNWEREIVVPPPSYYAYHAVTLYDMDDKFLYIQDSLGKEFKKLTFNYPTPYVYSFRDLPEGWRDLNTVLKLVRKKGTNEIFMMLGSERIWIKEPKDFILLREYNIIGNWNEIEDVDELPGFYNGRIIGKPNFSDYLKILFGRVK